MVVFSKSAHQELRNEYPLARIRTEPHQDVPGPGSGGHDRPRRRRPGHLRHVGTPFEALDKLVWKIPQFFV